MLSNNVQAYQIIGNHCTAGMIHTPALLSIGRGETLARLAGEIRGMGPRPAYKIRRGRAYREAYHWDARLSALRGMVRTVQALRVDAASWSEYVVWADLVEVAA